MTAIEGVRKWFSVSEASDRDLPAPGERLPDGWDEDDVVVEDEVKSDNKKTAAAANKKAAAAATTTTPARKSTSAAAAAAAPASPSPPKPDPVKTATPAGRPSKFNAAEEAKRLEVDKAPGVLAKVLGFLMPTKDGSVDTPERKSGKRRGRDEESSSSDDEEESDSDDETTGGDMGTTLRSLTAKQLDGKLTTAQLQKYAQENSVKVAAKARKADLIDACKKHATKAASSSGTPAAARRSASAPVAAASPTPRRAKPTAAQLSAMPPLSVDAKDEPQPNWAVTQMKEWAKNNRVDLGDAILKTEVLEVCLAAYDKKNKK